MVLVRRRGPFVDHLLRAFKSRGVPVAGIDRMVLTEQLAVMDLIALGEFCLLPARRPDARHGAQEPVDRARRGWAVRGSRTDAATRASGRR